MRLLLSGGGSGGHVFPALAVARALEDCVAESLDLLYVGIETGVEADLAREAGVAFQSVASRPLRGRNALSQLWSSLTIAAGVSDALKIMWQFRPDVVLVTGGHISVPVGVAAVLSRKPLVLFQPDIQPGWALRLLARIATRICVTDERSLRQLSARKAVTTGYPLRSVFDDLDKPIARARFQLNGSPALLVAGAVQGARRINDAIDADLERWVELAQIIHVTGPKDYRRMQERRETLPADIRHRYQVYEYLGDELPVAMAACDVAVSRAGASVLGEYPAARLPSVLVPLPIAGGHQRHNARALESRGAAVIVEDAEVPRALLPTVSALLSDPHRLDEMRRCAAAAATPNAARRIAKVLWEVRK